MSFTPTAEQNEIVRLSKTGDDLVVQAGAGTGKTATLKLIAEALPGKRLQYVAFNKAIVDESKVKMPKNVRCNTAHSLAFREIGKNYSHRMRGSRRMKPTELASRLGTEPFKVTTPGGETKTLSATYLAGLVMRSVRVFCQTADPEPTHRHVPYIDGIDAVEDGRRSYGNNEAVAKAILPAIRKAWADLQNTQGQLPYDHSAYLKMFQLSKPKLGVDVVLFDECQDANPVMLDIVSQQTHAQRIYVGDSAQQIYAFTGAVDALAKIEAQGCQVAYLSKSFRFGPAVADQANRILAMLPDTKLRLEGFDQIDSKVEALDEPRAVLTRTNAVAVRKVLNALQTGRKPALVGGSREIVSFAQAAEKLQAGQATEHPELACFDSWAEVQRYVSEDELGGDLKLMVDLIDEFGVDVILDALDQVADEDAADVIVSTAHKSKGREWDTVQLGEDFPEDRAKAGPEELRLLYVACTRARLTLDITGVAILADAEAFEVVAEVEAVETETGAIVLKKTGGQHTMPEHPDSEPITEAMVEAAREKAQTAAQDGSSRSRNPRAGFRASYRKGVAWIAENDEPELDDAEVMSGLVTTLLLADLFEKDPTDVARDIIRYRAKVEVEA